MIANEVDSINPRIANLKTMLINHTPKVRTEIKKARRSNIINPMSMYTIFMLWRVKSKKNTVENMEIHEIEISRISSKYLLYRQVNPTS